MMGRYLNVSLSTSGTRPSTAPRSQELSVKPPGCKTVFVGNLSWQATEEDLRACFAECGEVNNVRIAWDAEQDRSKGFGHVEFGQKYMRTRTNQARESAVSRAVMRVPLWALADLCAVLLCSPVPPFAESEDSVEAAVKCAGKEVAGRQIRVDYAPGS